MTLGDVLCSERRKDMSLCSEKVRVDSKGDLERAVSKIKTCFLSWLTDDMIKNGPHR